MELFKANDIHYITQTRIPILKGVSFDIKKGQTFRFDGKSGSGKSTLMKITAGIIVPSSGKIAFEGKDIHGMSDRQNRAFRKRMAFIFQDSALWANQNIMQNLSLPLQIHAPQMSPQERLEEIRNICHVVNYERSLELRPADLSMGEQKKVAFARALVLRPEILFLDEATESLDVKAVKNVMDILHNFVEAGNTMIYISHNQGFVNEFPGVKVKLKEGLIDEIQD
ncbi:MAG: ATP-binding cassette domain-containing protein [Treponema sp.]|nr:ATP-binding cassette domain-containing protein [Candidatus Treponema equi]